MNQWKAILLQSKFVELHKEIFPFIIIITKLSYLRQILCNLIIFRGVWFMLFHVILKE